MSTMKQMRALYAARETVKPRSEGEDGKVIPRKRKRASRAVTFRAWVRAQQPLSSNSPKLARILGAAR